MDQLVKFILEEKEFLKIGKLLQARLHAENIRKIMKDYGFYKKSDRSDLEFLEDIGDIFSINYKGVKIYPKYQFDKNNDQLYGISHVIKSLRPNFSDYELFLWFVQPNILTHDNSPLDYILLDDLENLEVIIKAEKSDDNEYNLYL
jgi:hypothetical protein